MKFCAVVDERTFITASPGGEFKQGGHRSGALFGGFRAYRGAYRAGASRYFETGEGSEHLDLTRPADGDALQGRQQIELGVAMQLYHALSGSHDGNNIDGGAVGRVADLNSVADLGQG
ncbi:MAG: hypothetical protein O7G83_08035 [Proteobacteria bacterium]|nr:hypothetical protein [Pseudomonadota bacterium]